MKKEDKPIGLGLKYGSANSKIRTILNINISEAIALQRAFILDLKRCKRGSIDATFK